MPRLKPRTLLIATGACLAVATLALFGAGAVAAEGALHPARRTVASICPCIAHAQCREAMIKSPDGTPLRSWYFEPGSGNGAAVILLHGIGATREDVVSLGSVFLKAGYSVLTPDLRGHGESGGIVTYGIEEEPDVHAWADWMLRQPHVSRIYGFGASLGASELLESLNRESRFGAVIAESPFASFPGIATERMGRITLLAPLVVDSGLLWVRLRYGVDVRQSSALEAVRRTHVPVLLIHGLKDGRTSPDNSRELAEANPGVTQLWLIPKAGHANAWATAGKEFEGRVLAWFAEHRNPI
jgi:pimeloyl-ACP methyl ester carboxylesterase